jgi:hypothetical protein
VHFYLLQALGSQCGVAAADDFVEGLLNTSGNGGSNGGNNSWRSDISYDSLMFRVVIVVVMSNLLCGL